MRYACLFVLFVGLIGNSQAQSNLVPDDVEFQVLKNLFDNTNGAAWTTKTNWPAAGSWPATATSAQFGTWFGVTVANGDISRITLTNNNLVGSIPASIGNLTQLQRLIFNQNKLNGTIPTTIGSLAKLEYLYLDNNQLTGSIPTQIGSLTQLKYLYLSTNQLTGGLPTEIGNLTSLIYLHLQSNPLGGVIPASFANLTNLNRLYLNSCGLTGEIPNLGTLVNMREFTMATNGFTSGPIPSWISQLTQLNYLSLAETNRTGSIPGFISQLSQLTQLSLNTNQLSGAIPASIGQLSNLLYLYLHSNQLDGTIPSEIGQLSNLSYLYLYGNRLSGSIPSEIGNISRLQILYLYNNQLSGQIPSSLGNLKQLVTLHLYSNPLTGTIPSALSGMTAIKNIQIYGTQISGTIPSSFGSLSNLEVLHLASNRLTGSLPKELASLTKLTQLYVHANQLSGSLPVEYASLPNLTHFYFFDNQITGEIPAAYGNLTKLKVFYGSKNKLVGPIPNSFSSLNQMTQFLLDGNRLSGSIPSNLFSTWTMLSQLNLGGNYFTGAFPSSIANCTQLSILAGASNSFTSLPPAVVSLPVLTSLQFDTNELTIIPPLQNQVNKANLTLNVGYNRLDYSVLEPLIGAGIKTVSNLTQKNINDAVFVSFNLGVPLTFTARPRGTATSNIKWEKLIGNAWTDISSSNADPPTGATYSIANATLGVEGKYRWSCTSSSVTAFTLTSEIFEVKANQRIDLDNLAFQYKYDERKRMTHKKVPGADWVFMVYDDRDRLVMTQDGEQRKLNKWTYTKYDVLNRPIITGIYTHGSYVDQAGMSALISKTVFSETYNGIFGNHGYSNLVFPTSALDVLTVTYYDNYTFKQLLNGAEYNYKPTELIGQPASESTRVTGQVTGTRTKVLYQVGDYGVSRWLNAVNYYDDKYRVVQSIADTEIGSTTRTTNIYDFTGKVMATKNTYEGDANVKWRDQTSGISTLGWRIYRSAGGSDQTQGMASVQMIPANQDGWFEFIHSNANMLYVGLSSSNPDNNFSSINYCLRLGGSTNFSVREYSSAEVSVSSHGLGDVFRMERIGGIVRVKKNGAVAYTFPTPSTSALMIDATFFSGQSSITYLRAGLTGTSSSTTRTFDYDHAGRLLKTWHQIDNNPRVLLASNEYNELGQLVDKKLYSTDNGTTFKQSVDYRYNIRGWLSSINNAQLDNSNPQINSDADVSQNDLFGMNLHYNEVVANLTLPNKEQYNGNISSIEWKNYGTTQKKGYGFDYDPMNRLTAANFATASASAWSASNSYHENGFTYDLNGNIKTLSRNGKDGAILDVLTYNYTANGKTGNQLWSVSDAGDKTKGFIDGFNVDPDYVYDANGNMIVDRNKGISTSGNTARIVYNHLNLPDRVTKSTGDYVKYTYDATGRKLAQQVFNLSNVPQKRTDYVGEYVYENEVLQFAQHEEGRVMMTDRKLLYQNDGTSTTGFTLVGVTTNFNTLNGEDYVVAVNTNASLTNGIFPIGGTQNVVAGERYLIRARGYRVGGADVTFRIRASGSTTDLLVGASLAPDAASERWTEQTITIPPGVTTLQVGLIWKTTAQNQQMYINDFEIIKLTAATPEYQYHLKDHLGNVRTTFTTKDESEAPVATLEANHVTEDRANFLKYDDARLVYSTIFDRTNGASPGYAQRLSGTSTEKMGLARSVAVMPGDKLKMEVYAKYFQVSNNDMTAYAAWVASMVSGSSVPNSIVDGAGYTNNTANTTPFGNVLDKTTEGAGVPKAYLNWVVFDENYVPILAKSGYRRISTTALQTVGTDGAHEQLESPEIEINEAGFAYIWLSNENETPVEVYFDDFTVVHTKSPVVQSEDYYPFGLTFNTYARENNTPNQYKLSGKELQDELGLGWIDYGKRMYQPEIGRWISPDPLAYEYFDQSPNNFVLNNPLKYVDPKGDSVELIIGKPYTDASGKEHPYGHVALRVYNSAEGYDNVYDFGRYGRVYWNQITGEGILNVYNNSEAYLKEEQRIRESYGYSQGTTIEEDKKIMAHFDQLIKNGAPYSKRDNKDRKSYKLDDYSITSNNCCTVSGGGLDQVGKNWMGAGEFDPREAMKTLEKNYKSMGLSKTVYYVGGVKVTVYDAQKEKRKNKKKEAPKQERLKDF